MRTRQYIWIRRAATRRRRQIRLRKSFLEGTFLAAVLLFLIGGAALDSEPAAGMILCVISLAYCALMIAQNPGKSFMRR